MITDHQKFLVRRMLAKINPDNVVVRSMPFGELIDRETRELIDVLDPDIAYGLAASIKIAADLIDESEGEP